MSGVSHSSDPHQFLACFKGLDYCILVPPEKRVAQRGTEDGGGEQEEGED